MSTLDLVSRVPFRLGPTKQSVPLSYVLLLELSPACLVAHSFSLAPSRLGRCSAGCLNKNNSMSPNVIACPRTMCLLCCVVFLGWQVEMNIAMGSIGYGMV